jgi:hypothetical protein
MLERAIGLIERIITRTRIRITRIIITTARIRIRRRIT